MLIGSLKVKFLWQASLNKKEALVETRAVNGHCI